MYLEILKKSFQQHLVYRGNSLMRVVVSFLYLFVTMSIWQALYRGLDTVDGVGLQDMLTYVLAAQFVRCLTRGGTSDYLAERIKSGSVAIDFARPISLKYAAMFTSWGQALFSAVFSGIPMVLLGSLIWGFKLPEHAGQWFFFALSVLLAVCLVSSFDYLMGLSVFWLKTDFHISWIMGALMALFSGMAIPLWFYPPTLRAIANFLPFRFYLYEPVAILIGRTTGADLVQVLLWQVFWIVLLNAIGYAIWQKARQVVVVQGG